jgi:hypothetical protein
MACGLARLFSHILLIIKVSPVGKVAYSAPDSSSFLPSAEGVFSLGISRPSKFRQA